MKCISKVRKQCPPSRDLDQLYAVFVSVFVLGAKVFLVLISVFLIILILFETDRCGPLFASYWAYFWSKKQG